MVLNQNHNQMLMKLGHSYYYLAPTTTTIAPTTIITTPVL